ncbi:hypothetical protein ACOMHN_012912 [Nucella lapillus]
MKPTADLQQRLEKFLQSLNYFSRTRPLVGVHMRTGGSKYFKDIEMKGRSKSTGPLWDFIQPYVSNGSDVFVASDNPDVLKSSAARFGSRHHDAAAVLRHIDQQRSDPSACQAQRGVILDQLILIRCDILILSPLSGMRSKPVNYDAEVMWVIYGNTVTQPSALLYAEWNPLLASIPEIHVTNFVYLILFAFSSAPHAQG